MSIILIGMPGAGKSTLGQSLATLKGLPFVDTDALIEQQLGCSLQQALDARGYLALREIEGKIISTYPWPAQPVVIATGGSAVYGTQAMQRLRELGLCVYLQISLQTVKARVKNWQSRGFAAAPGQSLESIFQEREALYQQFCHVAVPCDGLDQTQCLQRLQEVYAKSEGL